MREQLGLERAVPHPAVALVCQPRCEGDLGTSLLLGRACSRSTIERLPVSLSIALYALALTLVFGIVAGVLAALRQNSWLDQAAMTIALIGVSPAELLARPDADRPVLGAARLAADRRLCPFPRRLRRLVPGRHAAGDLAGAAADRPARAHHPLDHARGAAPGLHPHRARQGPARARRGRPSTRSRT